MKSKTAIIASLMLNLGVGGAVFAQTPRYRGNDSRYSSSSQSQAQQMVRQAYRDILRREPDRAGLNQYTDAILNRHWSDADVRRSLMSSDEYARTSSRYSRGNSGIYSRNSNVYGRSGYYGNTSDAANIVTRAYQSVLGRNPDASGMRNYTNRVVRDGWTERDVVRALRSSDEYRYRNR